VVSYFQVRDIGIVLVGDEDLEAKAIDIGEGELGTWVRNLASADRPRSLGPAGEIQAGQFTDIGPISILTVLSDSGNRCPCRHSSTAARTFAVRSKPTEK
jgi:hypothetical protein